MWAGWAVRVCPGVRPLGAGGRLFVGCPCFRGVFPAFWSLCCFDCGVLVANMALFRVLRGFLEGFGGVRVGLYWLRALRGLCGFCARVELGG